METVQTNNFQMFTQLPLKVMQKTNSAGGVVVVQTPHQGEVLIDLQIRDYAMFGANRTNEKPATHVVYQLQELETAAKEFLLKDWVTMTKSSPNQ